MMKRSVLRYELIGSVFIVILGSILHFAFEWAGRWTPIAIIAAINESVWEHLKLGFWPALFYTIFEYKYLKKSTNNFLFAKTIGIYLIPITITVLFYSYTALLGNDMLILDISIFVIAVIIGQLVSYKLLTSRRLPERLNTIALIALIILCLAFVLFTFYTPHLPIFRDPISGGYGIAK
jgi:hypothetical protein